MLVLPSNYCINHQCQRFIAYLLITNSTLREVMRVTYISCLARETNIDPNLQDSEDFNSDRVVQHRK